MSFRRFLMSFAAVSAMIVTPVASMAAPAFYHWYHAYDAPMSTCSDLIEEAAGNVSVESSDVKQYQTTVALDGARGIMRCLGRGPQKSWVVIIAYADRAAPAKEIFDRMRLVICGNCSDFVD